MATPPPSAATTQKEFALEVVKHLHTLGYEALWAGGCVRDRLLGKPPKDYDVATSATPEQVRQAFGKRRTLAIGAAFGVISVLAPKGIEPVEVATFRSEAGYTDGRRPDLIQFTTAEIDASRRDFTINGLFLNPLTNEVVDYVGGQEDLEKKQIRAIGEAAERFDEDKLRLLRAARFASTLGFTIESQTLAAIQQHAAEIGVVSAERIGAELQRMLLHAHRRLAIETLRETDLLRHVLPEVHSLPAEDYLATLETLERLPSPNLAVAIAALLCKTESPQPKAFARRLRLPNQVGEDTEWLLKHFDKIPKADSMAWSELQPLLAHRLSGGLVDLTEAILGSETAATRHCRDRLAWPAERLDPAPLVDGSDLIQAGHRPGPSFAKLLQAIRARQLDGLLNSQEEALRFAAENQST